jgi:hypothetical protein
MEDRAMPQIVEPTEPDAQREIIRLALDEIASEVGTALREAYLDFPVFLTVPNSGESLATMSCPLDPSDNDWSRASAIVCRIIGQRLGDVRLRGRALHCAMANGTIAATDVMDDTRRADAHSCGVLRPDVGRFHNSALSASSLTENGSLRLLQGDKTLVFPFGSAALDDDNRRSSARKPRELFASRAAMAFPIKPIREGQAVGDRFSRLCITSRANQE